MTYDASDRKHVKQADKRAKALDSAHRDVVVGIMASASGRSWMLGLLERCHLFVPSFNPNALSMAFAEGERNIGLQLLADIMRHCPNQYTLMMQERNERDITAERSRDASGNGAEHDDNPGDRTAYSSYDGFAGTLG